MIKNRGREDNASKESTRLTKYQKIDIVLKILAILGAFGCVIAGGYISYHLWQTQVSSSKHAAASELSIEINSINQSLRPYVVDYLYNIDLSDPGMDIPVGSSNNQNSFLLLGYYPFDFSNNSIDKNNNPVIYEFAYLQGVYTFGVITGIPFYKIDGKMVYWYPESSYLDGVPNVIKDGTPQTGYSYMIPDYHLKLNCKVDNPIIPGPLYSDHGAYYVYQTDISRFNESLAQNLYTYYNLISRAETDRQNLQEYTDSHPNTTLDEQHFNTYMDMRIDILLAHNMTSTVLDGLDKE